MTPALLQRVAALAGVALLAAVVALVVSNADSSGRASTGPRPVLAPDGGWYHAMAAVHRFPLGRRTSCGLRSTTTLRGFGDPVLPCGAKIFIGFGSNQLVVPVVDRGSAAPGHRFDLTPATADALGVRGVQPVRWAFAR
jgi:hypothetical protein